LYREGSVRNVSCCGFGFYWVAAEACIIADGRRRIGVIDF
jgi:hypothetical protein